MSVRPISQGIGEAKISNTIGQGIRDIHLRIDHCLYIHNQWLDVYMNRCDTCILGGI